MLHNIKDNSWLANVVLKITMEDLEIGFLVAGVKLAVKQPFVNLSSDTFV